LDRCQDSAVASVLEAINLVLEGCKSERLKIFTVLGLDMEMTVKAIYSFYNSSATTEKVENERITREESRRFLQKIVQVSIDVPPTSEGSREKFIERLFEGTILPQGGDQQGGGGPEQQGGGVAQQQGGSAAQRQGGGGAQPRGGGAAQEQGGGTSKEQGCNGAQQQGSGTVQEGGVTQQQGGSAEQQQDGGGQQQQETGLLQQKLGAGPRQGRGVSLENGLQPSLDVTRTPSTRGRRFLKIILEGPQNNDLAEGMFKRFSPFILPNNPRDMKRMVNNYRLARIVLEWSGEVDDIELIRKQLVIWVVLVVSFLSLAPQIAWLCRQGDSSDISGGPGHKPGCAAGSQTHMDGTLCRS
jgi:hypothetical protein